MSNPESKPAAGSTWSYSLLRARLLHLDHWARVGRAVSQQHSAARRRVEAALAGELASDELTLEVGVVCNDVRAYCATDSSHAQRCLIHVDSDHLGDAEHVGVPSE